MPTEAQIQIVQGSKFICEECDKELYVVYNNDKRAFRVRFCTDCEDASYQEGMGYAENRAIEKARNYLDSLELRRW